MSDCGGCELCSDGLDFVQIRRDGKTRVGNVGCVPGRGVRTLFVHGVGDFDFSDLGDLVGVLSAAGFVVESAGGSILLG